MPHGDDSRDQGDVSTTHGTPNMVSSHQKLGETLPANPQREPTLLTTCQSWTSGSQSWETIHFCCLNHPVCRTFLQQCDHTNWRHSGYLSLLFWAGIIPLPSQVHLLLHGLLGKTAFPESSPLCSILSKQLSEQALLRVALIDFSTLFLTISNL